jgi:acetyl/propionyl-CoA carboxylase alpha subunit
VSRFSWYFRIIRTSRTNAKFWLSSNAKGTTGGGGKGMRAVWRRRFIKAWDARQSAAAGNDGMYLEN